MTPNGNWIVGQEFKICSLGNILVLIWTGTPSVTGTHAWGQVLLSLRQRDLSLGLLTIIEPQAGQGTLDAPVRSALGKVIKEHEPAIRAAAIVFEAQGFRATVVRSVVTAITMASRPAFPSAVFSDRLTGAAWLMDKMGRAANVSAAEVSALLRQVQKQNVTVTH